MDRGEDRMEFEHTSVLLEETIECLQIKPDGTYVDGTLGGGGHSDRIAAALSRDGRLFGCDSVNNEPNCRPS